MWGFHWGGWIHIIRADRQTGYDSDHGPQTYNHTQSKYLLCRVATHNLFQNATKIAVQCFNLSPKAKVQTNKGVCLATSCNINTL